MLFRSAAWFKRKSSFHFMRCSRMVESTASPFRLVFPVHLAEEFHQSRSALILIACIRCLMSLRQRRPHQQLCGYYQLSLFSSQTRNAHTCAPCFQYIELRDTLSLTVRFVHHQHHPHRYRYRSRPVISRLRQPLLVHSENLIYIH
jgi:hypothetical protein